MSRIRANNITNGAGTGAPTFPHGAVINGISTITANISLNASELTVGTGNTINGTTDNTLKILTNGSERVIVSAGGSIGIGTNRPITNVMILGSESRAGEGLVRIRNDHTTTGQPAWGLGITRQANNVRALLLGSDDNNNAAICVNGNNSLIFGEEVSGTWTEHLRIGSAGQIGVGGENYGTAGQVLKSNGNSAGPTWQNLSQFYFYGQQDSQHNISTGTYTRIRNLGTNAISLGSTTIAVWDEDQGTLTIGDDGAGIYYLAMTAGIDDIQAGDYVQTVIGKNGGTTSVNTAISAYGRAWLGGNVSNQIVAANTFTIADLSAGDVVRFYVHHNEGSTEPTEPNRTSAMGYKIN